jgi:hypothetical protein
MASDLRLDYYPCVGNSENTYIKENDINLFKFVGVKVSYFNMYINQVKLPLSMTNLLISRLFRLFFSTTEITIFHYDGLLGLVTKILLIIKGILLRKGAFNQVKRNTTNT